MGTGKHQRIAIQAILWVLLFFVVALWLGLFDRQASQRGIAEAQDNRELVEQVLMQQFPVGYLDSMVIRADEDSAAVWAQDSSGQSYLFWTGTVKELRSILIAKRDKAGSVIP